MDVLPSNIGKLLSSAEKVMNVVFEIDENGGTSFLYSNEQFVAFHLELGVKLDPTVLKDMRLEDYFRLYLGFTDDQIESRTKSLKEAVKSGTPYSFEEVSDHPNMPVLILNSAWIPLTQEGKTYVIWESSVYTQTRLD